MPLELRQAERVALGRIQKSNSKGEKTMFRRSIHVSVTLASMLAFTIMARAQGVCSASGIAGTYVIKCSGYLTPGPNAPMVPAALLAKGVGEPNGNWSGTGTVSLGGVIVTQDVKSVGPTEVKPDCTGSITYSQTINGQPGPNIHFNFIVGKNSAVIDGIGTDPGSVFSCTLTRVSKPD